MNGKSHNTAITGLALIFPAEAPQKAEGGANFLATDFLARGVDIPVRQFTPADRKRMIENLKGESGDQLAALVKLHNRLTAGDSESLQEAKKILEELGPHDAATLHRFASDVITRPAMEIGCFIGSYLEFMIRSSERLQRPRFADLHRWFCFEVTNRINAQIVLWWYKGKFVPAIYCRSLEAAYFIDTLFISEAGAIGWRICPFCSKWFPQRRVGQEYCSPTHGDSFRMRRMRLKRKQEAKTEMKRGKQDGAKKTR